MANKNKGGRPTVMTQSVLDKLETVFGMGGTDKEACFYAGISEQALYDYQNKYPEFTERKEALKQTPILKTRKTLFASLDTVQGAQWYASRKLKAEFGDSIDVNTTGSITLEPDQRIIDLAKKLNQ